MFSPPNYSDGVVMKIGLDISSGETRESKLSEDGGRERVRPGTCPDSMIQTSLLLAGEIEHTR